MISEIRSILHANTITKDGMSNIIKMVDRMKGEQREVAVEYVLQNLSNRPVDVIECLHNPASRATINIPTTALPKPSEGQLINLMLSMSLDCHMARCPTEILSYEQMRRTVAFPGPTIYQFVVQGACLFERLVKKSVEPKPKPQGIDKWTWENYNRILLANEFQNDFVQEYQGILPKHMIKELLGPEGEFAVLNQNGVLTRTFNSFQPRLNAVEGDNNTYCHYLKTYNIKVNGEDHFLTTNHVFYVPEAPNTISILEAAKWEERDAFVNFNDEICKGRRSYTVLKMTNDTAKAVNTLDGLRRMCRFITDIGVIHDDHELYQRLNERMTGRKLT